jgi:hypothetical protein
MLLFSSKSLCFFISRNIDNYYIKKMSQKKNLTFHDRVALSLCAVSMIVIGIMATSYRTPYVNYAQAAASSSVVVTLNVTAGISINAPGNVTMSTPITVSQNNSIGTTTWTVITNDSNGYTLAVNATSSPAMKSGANSIADYQTSSPNTWSVAASSANFGYSVYGTDSPTGTWGTDSNCGTGLGTPSTNLKYLGFTTSPYTVASRSSTTTPSGISTTVCYAAAQGTSFFIPSGTYVATIVATATSL